MLLVSGILPPQKAGTGFSTVELIGVLVVLAIGIAAFYVLRPKAKAAE